MKGGADRAGFPQGVEAVAEHKFVSGDRVDVLPDKLNPHVRPGVYTIIRAMPVTGQGYQYRAKSALDNHERVFDESQLHMLPGASPSHTQQTI